MEKLNHAEVVNLLIQLSLMLGIGRLLAELVRVFKQPAVVGEIIAGIILGPTILGAVSPDTFQWLFPASGPSTIALDGFIQLSVILLLFIAGLEVELHIVWPTESNIWCLRYSLVPRWPLRHCR